MRCDLQGEQFWFFNLLKIKTLGHNLTRAKTDFLTPQVYTHAG